MKPAAPAKVQAVPPVVQPVVEEDAHGEVIPPDNAHKAAEDAQCVAVLAQPLPPSEDDDY